MDASTPINRSGNVMVSVAALRRLISNAKQAEMAEEMLNDVINARLGLNGYRLAGIAANCEDIKWIEYPAKTQLGYPARLPSMRWRDLSGSRTSVRRVRIRGECQPSGVMGQEGA